MKALTCEDVGCDCGEKIYSRDGIELRPGRWQEVLADVGEVDATITDPPFSPRTAEGSKSTPDWGAATPLGEQGSIGYGSITKEEVEQCVEWFWPRTRNWFIVFGDHISQAWWAGALTELNAYVFAPLPWVKTNGAPRFLGDGPASQTEWITVARRRRDPRKDQDRGSRPGYYLVQVPRDSELPGQKSLDGMRAIIRDYTRPGDLICDPFAGTGTTLLAAAIEGRRAIGAEQDAETFAKAKWRLRSGWTPTMFSEVSR